MSPARHWLARHGWTSTFVLLFVAIGLWIALRNAGLYPTVLSDEYVYSTDARLRPLADAVRPGYLYLAIYRATNTCGDGFLACARLLNLAFFAAAGGFVYLCARRVMTTRLAMVVALLSLAAPCNTYTAYFMPEALFYFGFWLLMWVAVELRPDSGLWHWTALGLCAGCLALVKPHGLFLIPALCVHGALLLPSAQRWPVRWIFVRAATIVLGAIAVKLAVSYAIAGPAGVTAFGASYNVQANQIAMMDRPLAALASAIGASLLGHAMAVAFLFAMPLATVVASSVAAATGLRGGDRGKVVVLALTTIGTLICVSACFTASTAGAGAYETADRLHMRYYDFALPWLLIVGGMGIGAAAPRRSLKWIVAAFALTTVAIAMVGFGAYEPTVVDAPEILGLAARTPMRRVFALLMLASLALLIWRPRAAAPFFLCVLMPWYCVKAMEQNDDHLAIRMSADRFDRAGLVARRLLPVAAIDHLRVIADDSAGAYRALFHLDDAQARMTVVEPGEAVTSAMWPEPDEWALVIGDHPIDEAGVDRLDLGGFVLAHRTDRAVER